MLRRILFSLLYLHKPVWDTGVSPPELVDFIATSSPGRALDVGCGTGTNLITLAKSGWQVTGIDFTPWAIQIAKKKSRLNHVQADLRIKDVTRLDVSLGCFDLILDMGCFHSLPPNKRPSYISKINQLLADTGTYLLYLFIKPNTAVWSPGATAEDIHFITNAFELVTRRDSTERGIRASAWFMLKKLT